MNPNTNNYISSNSNCSLLKALVVLCFLIVAITFTGCNSDEQKTPGIISTLRVSADNPRYFSDSTGNIVYLTGAHTWSNLIDADTNFPPEPFDFNKYLNWLQAHNHNFIRMWTWEMLTWSSKSYRPVNHLNLYPHPYARTGPGIATDRRPKFDLTRYDQEYFRRLSERIEEAGKRGIYVSVMLFEGWSMQFASDSWKNHFFYPGNNINGVNGDINNDGSGLEIYTLADSTITDIQEKYVKHVIDAVNHLDNVLFEISNENHPPSTAWQYHMINLIHDYEKQKPKQHPAGMTFQYKGGSNDVLLESPAEWISPNSKSGNIDVRNNPPAADGRKVILYDTDHLGGIWGNQPWVWKTFLRAMNPLFMDTYDGSFIPEPSDKNWEAVRKSMGYTHNYAVRMDLKKSIPRNELATTTYCLADPGMEYIIYQEIADSSFDVTMVKGKYEYEWFDPTTGIVKETGTIKVPDGETTFRAPFNGDAVLYLRNIRKKGNN